MADGIQMNLDDGTRAAIQDRVQAAQQLSGNQEEDAKKGLISNFTPVSVNYGDAGISEAIANKYNKMAQGKIDQIKQLNKLNYAHEAMGNIRGANELEKAQIQFEQQQKMVLRKRQMAEDSQRSAILGQLLGVVGAVVGAVYGGGPTGAAAGAAAGKAIGDNVSGHKDVE